VDYSKVYYAGRIIPDQNRVKRPLIELIGVKLRLCAGKSIMLLFLEGFFITYGKRPIWNKSEHRNFQFKLVVYLITFQQLKAWCIYP